MSEESDADLAGDVDAGSREHYVDAVLYDYEYRRRRDDIRFYRRLGKELLGGHGRILDLACGTGRLTRGLLRDGHTVTGLDISADMLARAKSRFTRLGRAAKARATLVRADMRTFELDEKFPLIVMGFNSFEHLYTRGDVAACLARVREHLEPGGRFAFDVQNPDLRWLCRDDRRRWARTRFTHPETGEKMIYSTNHLYDPVSQIVMIKLYYELAEPTPGRGEEVVRLSQRKFFPAELEGLVAANGFVVEARYGDFDGDPLHPDCENQLLVCRVA